MATLIFYPNDEKISKKTGKIPMYLRVVHLGGKAEASLKNHITESERTQWNVHSMCFEPAKSPLNWKLVLFTNNDLQFNIYCFLFTRWRCFSIRHNNSIAHK
jgi:hypothetical protein